MPLQSPSVAFSAPCWNNKVCCRSEGDFGDTRRLHSAEMPVNSLRWETLQALENSPKAKVTFDPYWSERGEVSRFLENKVRVFGSCCFDNRTFSVN